jgi:TolA-binding protein
LAPGVRVEQAGTYYQGLALEKLGQSDQARTMFNQLIDTGTKLLNGGAGRGTEIADAHYLVGLGKIGLNNRAKAQQEFALAIKTSPDHFAAERALREMTDR